MEGTSTNLFICVIKNLLVFHYNPILNFVWSDQVFLTCYTGLKYYAAGWEWGAETWKKPLKWADFKIFGGTVIFVDVLKI